MNHIDDTALQQFIHLLSSAFTKASTDGATPAISQTDLPAVGGYQWHRVQFDAISQLQIFVGSIKRADESAELVDAETRHRLVTVFSILGEHFGNESGRKTIASVQDVEAGPDKTLVSLQVQASGGIGELIVSLDATAVNWLATRIVKKEPKSARMSMMDTLMDVELPVSILLAKREASLSDVLQWGPGAIIEFEAGLADPVDVIVNDQTVARGCVVLVDGNYGVRVTEVLAGKAAFGAF